VSSSHRRRTSTQSTFTPRNWIIIRSKAESKALNQRHVSNGSNKQASVCGKF
jgi:hypothetical protein